MATGGKDSPDDLRFLVSEQLRELIPAQAMESDMDIAFRLQLQEALAASLVLYSSPPPPPEIPNQKDCDSFNVSSIQSDEVSKFELGRKGGEFVLTENRKTPPVAAAKVPGQNDGDSYNFAKIQSEELSKFEVERSDREFVLTENRKIREKLDRRIHDQKVAREILSMSEAEWEEWGDVFEEPFGEGCSSSVKSNEVFRLYFKGLTSEEGVGNSKFVLTGIGFAICDSRDNLIVEMRKPMVGNGLSRQAAECKALIEGLNAALDLDFKRVEFFCDHYPLYQFFMRRWKPKQHKISTLIGQVTSLRRKFSYCNPVLVARNDIKFAFKLARDAIDSQITMSVESSHGKNLKENCVICLEDTDIGSMFSVDGCRHRYCFSCMKQHVEVKLLLGMLPKCPHDGCKSELNVYSCRKFLTPKMIETMNQRIKEASIPVSDKIYCPYPRCSALMSKSEIFVCAENAFLRSEQFGARKCIKCEGLFCANCKVPWHRNMSCYDYKRLHPDLPAEDIKLKSLATSNSWRQCVKCSHMIELAEGCYHMICRCGYEFCYNCGAEYKKKKATCSCPLWDENNILHEDDIDFEFEDDEIDEDFEEDEYSDDSESDRYY